MLKTGLEIGVSSCCVNAKQQLSNHTVGFFSRFMRLSSQEERKKTHQKLYVQVTKPFGGLNKVSLI